MKRLPLWAGALFILMPQLVLAQKVLLTPEDCPSIYLTSHEHEKGRYDSAQFSATEIMDLQIHVTLGDQVQGDRILRLKLYTPDNHLYQELTQPLTTRSQLQGNLRRVDGYPRPLRVKPVGQIPVAGISARGVTIGFPVGGTNIVSAALYGTWRIEAYLDDSTTPCSQDHQFIIKP